MVSLEKHAPTEVDRRSKARPRWLFSRLWPLLRGAAFVYLSVALILMLFETQLIFPAPSYPHGDWEPLGLNQEDVYFSSEDGTQLHGWLLKHPQPALCILFCHGNAEHVADLADLLYKYHAEYQATVFAFDYRGYGRSEGRPNERGVLADGHAAHVWLANHLGVRPTEIVIVGRSLGGAVAVELAATNGARGLVLERTFSSLPEVASRHFPWLPVKLLMRNRFDSVKKIAAYQGPLLQTHGTADEVVPFELGKRLFDTAVSREKTFIVAEGGTHNEPHRREYWNALAAFVERLAMK